MANLTDHTQPTDQSRFDYAAKINTTAQAITNIILNAPTRQAMFEQEGIIAEMLKGLIVATINSVTDQVVPEGNCPDPEEWKGQMWWLGAQSRVRQRLLSLAEDLDDAELAA